MLAVIELFKGRKYAITYSQSVQAATQMEFTVTNFYEFLTDSTGVCVGYPRSQAPPSFPSLVVWRLCVGCKSGLSIFIPNTHCIYYIVLGNYTAVAAYMSTVVV